ncbi:Cytochrome c oxidase assembly protein cox11, mitochondrial [Sarracenia purpurea var. burkii]
MSRSRDFRWTQIWSSIHNFSSGYRCLPENWERTRNFVGINSSRYGQGFSYPFRGVMTRCELSKGLFGKCNPVLHQRTLFLGRPCSLLDLQCQYSTYAAREKKSNRMLLYLTGLVFAMVGCTYAAVPLYRTFCQATGYGGTVQRRESVEEKIARHAQDGTITNREISVQFNADVADGMPWKFIPTQREVRVKPGESALAFYTAENRSSTPITGVSTYNVTPMKAAVYFNKIQCFCFEEQRLLPGEQIDMPVFFYIDPEFETDPKMDGINSLILSYTFFKVSEE